MRIAVIGLGARIRSLLGAMQQYGFDVELVAVADINCGVVEQNWKENPLIPGAPRFYTDARQMLMRENALDMVMVGTVCSEHARYGAMIMEAGYPLFMEKPLAITSEDLDFLRETMVRTKATGITSLTLRFTPIAQKAKQIVDSGILGIITQVQAVNNVPYGANYYHAWYRFEEMTGGLFLQKGIHDMDCLNYIINDWPVEVLAMTSKQYYKGDKAEKKLCKECEDWYTCAESPWVKQNIVGDTRGSRGEMCCFARDTGNEDSGSVLMRYENGMHAVYTQNFVAKRGAALRGIRVIGSNATLWMELFSEEIRVWKHGDKSEEIMRFGENLQSFFGGDTGLIRNLYFTYTGQEAPIATLEDGIRATRLALMAKQAAELGILVKLGKE